MTQQPTHDTKAQSPSHAPGPIKPTATGPGKPDAPPTLSEALDTAVEPLTRHAKDTGDNLWNTVALSIKNAALVLGEASGLSASTPMPAPPPAPAPVKPSAPQH